MNATLIRGALIGAVVGSSIAIGQPPTSVSPLNPPANGPRHADVSWSVLSNATVHTKPGEVIEHGTVVIRDGRIEAVLPAQKSDKGEAKAADGPAGAKVWDCTGLHVYPGFIDAFVEVDAPRPDPSQPGVHWNSHVTPQRSALDGTGIDSATAESLRKLGFTAAGIAPSGGNFRGKGAVVSLAKPASDLSEDRPPVYSRNAYHVLSIETGRGFGGRGRNQTPGQAPGNPAVQAAAQDQSVERWSGYPDSQMGAIALVRQTLIDQEWQEQARKAGSQVAFNALDALSPEWARNAPDNTVAALPIGNTPRNGQELMPLLFDTDDELDALRCAKIAREFKRPAMLVGSGSEYKRVDAIKADGLPIILPLRYPRTPDVSTIGKSENVDLKELMTWEQAPTNPRRLEAAGVKFALTTAKLRNRSEFSANLSQALKHGLSPEAAIAAVTTRPAELLGVSDKLGTIEKGRIANLVVAEGDMFEAWPKPKASDAPADGEPKAGDDAAKPEADAGPGDDEIDANTAGLQPPARQRGQGGGRGGFGGGAGAFAGGGGGGRATGVKVRDVWIDGQREEINAAPALKLTGTWEVTLIPAPEGAAKLTIDDRNGVTAWLGDKSVRTGSFTLTDNRVSFQVDDSALGLKGTSLVSGVVEGEEMHGTGVNGAGEAFNWSAKRTSMEVPRDPGMRRGGGGGFRPRGDMPPREGGDGAPGNPDAKPPEGKPAEPKPAEGGDPKKDAPADKPAEGDAPRRDRGQPGGDQPRGPQNRRAPEQDEKDAIAAIPEKLGYPFGPYAMEQIPEQEKILVTNATIWTEGPQGVIEKGWMLVEGGKVSAIGSGSAPAANGAKTIDATGKHIAPGIIDCHSHTGISKGVNEGGQAVTAEVRIQDVTNPDAVEWYRQLAGGTTCVNNLHGSANAIGGQNCVNKIRWGVARPDDMHLEGAIPGIKFALGENPRQVNFGGGGGRGESSRYPASRMGVETLIRDRFTAAGEYASTWAIYGAYKGTGALDGLPETFKRVVAKYHTGSFGDAKSPAMPRRDLELEALAEVLGGERLVHCHSYRQDELLMLCRVSDDFGFKIGTFQHVLEGYKVADEIAKHSLGGSCFSDWWAYKVEVQDAIPADGPIMAEQGVTVSYNSDSDELARRLNVEAGKAMKYGGLKPEEALKFVTINPAKQLMIDKQVGSLEKGKDADFAIWSGPPMSSLSRCEATWVDGRKLFSLEDDAKARAKIASERTRLIQKVLAAAKNGRGGGGGGFGGGPGGPPGGDTRPTGGMLQRYYMDLIERGYDPEANRPGDCGCYQK